jgi:hypothetical protein
MFDKLVNATNKFFFHNIMDQEHLRTLIFNLCAKDFTIRKNPELSFTVVFVAEIMS